MSHISTYAQKVTDILFFCTVARKRGYKVTQQMFSSGSIEKTKIELPGWRFPITITNEGIVQYDHWGSEAGSMDRLGELFQDYNRQLIEKNIPYDQIFYYSTEDLSNGDKKMVLEYN